jgi:hypothetical protein
VWRRWKVPDGEVETFVFVFEWEEDVFVESYSDWEFQEAFGWGV